MLFLHWFRFASLPFAAGLLPLLVKRYLVKRFLDGLIISSVFLIVKRFLDVFSKIFCGGRWPGQLGGWAAGRLLPPEGDLTPGRPGRVSVENTAKIKKFGLSSFLP